MGQRSTSVWVKHGTPPPIFGRCSCGVGTAVMGGAAFMGPPTGCWPRKTRKGSCPEGTTEILFVARMG